MAARTGASASRIRRRDRLEGDCRNWNGDTITFTGRIGGRAAAITGAGGVRVTVGAQAHLVGSKATVIRLVGRAIDAAPGQRVGRMGADFKARADQVHIASALVDTGAKIRVDDDAFFARGLLCT